MATLKIILGLGCLLPLYTCSPHVARETRQLLPSGHCDIFCPDDEIPTNAVCGSDGVSYKSECELRNAACRARANGGSSITSVRKGQCITMNSDCALVHQTGFYCDISTKPVCGSDDNTYRNECNLFRAYCKSLEYPGTAQLSLAYRGHCLSALSNKSRTLDCDQYVDHTQGMVAVEPGVVQRVSIRTCPRTYTPLCTLEGITYSNECSYCRHLALQHIITPTNLTAMVSHDGPCSNGGIISVG